MRGSSHEALGLAAAYTALKVPLFEGHLDGVIDTSMDTAALPLAAMSLGVLIVWEALASARQRSDLRAAAVWQAEKLQEGLSAAHVEGLKARGHAPPVRWRGPPRKLSRPLRLIALLAALSVAVPVGVALATSRLPDLLEAGPINHRGPTHWLLTAAGLIVGTSWLLQDYRYGAAITVGLAIGYLGHLVADGLTLSGVPYLWPVWREDLHLLPQSLRVRMGSPVDTLFALGVLGAMVLSLTPHGTAPALADQHVCKHRHKHPVTHTHKRCHHARGQR